MSQLSRDDLDFMKHPEKWPLYVCLPLKHSTDRDGRGFPRVSILFYLESTGKYRFYDNMTIYDFPTGIDPTLEGGQEILEEIIKEGWIVD